MNVSVRTSDGYIRSIVEGARAGDMESLRFLAEALVSGDACERDLEEAFRVFSHLALRGDPAAMVRLGGAYESAGEIEAARAWYTRAAEFEDLSGVGRLVSLLGRHYPDDEDAQAEGIGWAFRMLETGDDEVQEHVWSYLPDILRDVPIEVHEAAGRFAYRTVN